MADRKIPIKFAIASKSYLQLGDQRSITVKVVDPLGNELIPVMKLEVTK